MLQPVTVRNIMSQKETKFKTANELDPNDQHEEPEEGNHVKFKDIEKNTRNFFSSRQKKANLVGNSNEQSLNIQVRNREFQRIMADNEAMLKRLQASQSNYNVLSWERDRRQQVKLIKQICHYKPTMIRKRRVKRRGQDGEDLLDMKTRYASAGPNRHMFEMYNYSVGSTSMLGGQQTNAGVESRLVQSHLSANVGDQSFQVPNQFFPGA